jgi:8-oxo-dGTP diphosphatase
MTSRRPHVHVACAIIEQDGLVLSAQRSSLTSLPLKWEFPGGKLNPGETPVDCLHREIMEEMGVQVTPTRQLAPSIHHYPDFSVTLYPFICTITGGSIVLHEHVAMVWLPPEELHSLDWAAADLPILSDYRESRAQYQKQY